MRCSVALKHALRGVPRRQASHEALCRAAEEATLGWLDETVLGMNICPFAASPRLADAVRCVASPAGTVAALMPVLREESRRLAALPVQTQATTLVVAPRCAELRSFSGMLSLLASLEALDEVDAGLLQVVGFHPAFRFEGEEDGDAAAFTNRSPFPTVHLLRERDVTAALAAVPNAGEEVPRRNAVALRALGSEALEAKLEKMRHATLRSALGLRDVQS